MALFAAILSALYFVNIQPVLVQSGSNTLQITWSDQAKIDGGKIKGFAKTKSGEIFYVTYPFVDEIEKEFFLQMNLPAYKFEMFGHFSELEIPSHPYAFNMQKYFRMYGASGAFEAEALISIVKSESFLTKITAQRKKVKQLIHETFPPSLISEAEALLIGDRSGMDEEDASDYRRLGITHLFAISGLHVGLLTLLFRECLCRCRIRIETVNALLIILLPLYALIVGGAPSVWRAVSVSILILLTVQGRLSIRLDDALAISAVVFICIQPYIVYQPGFQLSYVAAISLIYSSKILLRSSSTIHTMFLITMISQFSLYPILLHHFYELSLSSFLVNILYVPLYSFIILPANIILLFIAGFFLPFANFCFLIYEPFRTWVSLLTKWISAIPYQLWIPGKPNSFQFILAYIGLFVFFIRFEKEGKLVRNFAFILIPALLLHFQPYFDGKTKVTFLDVGQGDSAVIELPYRRGVYVIDTGGRVSFGGNTWKTPSKPFEIGRKIVVPYLKGKGITTIDKLILTHADADHIEGADEVIEELRVKEIHYTPGSYLEEAMRDVVMLAKKYNIPMVEQKEGEFWQVKDIHFRYLAPSQTEYKGNDSSLVLFMQTTGLRFLFTGDLEADGENELLYKYSDFQFSPLILKAGHHGSRTSSSKEFIEWLKPTITVFSSGRNNLYGHPHPDVLSTFEENHLKTYTTAESGSISILIDNEKFTVKTMSQSQ